MRPRRMFALAFPFVALACSREKYFGPPPIASATTSSGASATVGSPALSSSSAPHQELSLSDGAVFTRFSLLGAPLFRDEVDAIRDVTLRTLERERIVTHVVPMAELAKLHRINDEGRLAEGGPICAQKPTFDDVVHARWPGATEIAIEASCFGGGCRLDVATLRAPKGPGGFLHPPLVRLSADVRDPLAPSSFRDAADELGPLKPLVRTGGIARGETLGREERRRFLIVDVTAYGFQTQVPPEASFRSVQSELDRCYDPSFHEIATERATLSVSPSGVIDRCELFADERHASPSVFESCVCGSLARANLPPGVGTRRISLALAQVTEEGPVLRGGLEYIARIEKERLSGAPLGHFEDTERALATCHAEGRGERTMRVPLSLEIDAAGLPTGAKLGNVPTKLKGCLERALLASRHPCAFDGQARSFEGVLVLAAEKHR